MAWDLPPFRGWGDKKPAKTSEAPARKEEGGEEGPAPDGGGFPVSTSPGGQVSTAWDTTDGWKLQDHWTLPRSLQREEGTGSIRSEWDSGKPGGGEGTQAVPTCFQSVLPGDGRMREAILRQWCWAKRGFGRLFGCCCCFFVWFGFLKRGEIAVYLQVSTWVEMTQ